MRGYQDSILILKNISAVTKLALKKEGQFVYEKTVPKPATKIPLRNSGEVRKDISSLSNEIIKKQQELNRLTQPIKNKPKLLKEKEALEAVLNKTIEELKQSEHDPNYITATSKGPELQREIYNKKEELQELTNFYNLERHNIKNTYLSTEKKEKLDQLDEKFKKEKKELSDSIRSLEAKQASHQEKIDRVSWLEKEWSNINNRLQNVNNNLKIIEQYETEEYQEKIRDLEEEIDELKIDLAGIKIELKDKTTFNISEIAIDEDEEEEIINLFPKNIIHTLINTQNELSNIEEQIKEFFNNSENVASKEVYVIMSNIRLYSDKISQLTQSLADEKLTEGKELRKELDKYKILKEKEENKLDIKLAEFPDIANLIKKRNELKLKITNIDKTQSSLLMLKDNLTNSNSYEEALKLTKEYYKKNKKFYIYKIAELSFNYILKNNFFNTENIVDEIKNFTYIPGAEQAVLDYPGIMNQEETERHGNIRKLNENKIMEFVNDIIRKDRDLHFMIINELQVNFPKFLNETLQYFNSEDLFAEIFFNYPAKGFSRGEKSVVSVKEISSNIKPTITIVANRLIKYFRDFLESKENQLEKLQEIFNKENEKYTPKVAEIEKREIYFQSENKQKEAYEEIKNQNAPEDLKKTVLERAIYQIKTEEKYLLSQVEERDTDLLISLSEKIKGLKENVKEEELNKPIALQNPKLPNSKAVVDAVSESFEYIADNPNVNFTEGENSFVKLLDLSKDIFKYVSSQASNGNFWAKAYPWTRKASDSFKLTDVSAIFMLNLDPSDSKKGTLTITLSVVKSVKYFSFGEIEIKLAMDEAGNVSSSLSKVEPINIQQNEEFKLSTNKLGNKIRMKTMIHNCINKVAKKYPSFSKKELMLNPEAKAQIIDMSKEYILDWMVKAQVVSGPSEEILQIIQKQIEQEYNKMIPTDVKTARLNKLLQIRKLAF